MIGTTAIFIPTFGRPHVLESVYKNIEDATALPHQTYFIAESRDQSTIDTLNLLRFKYVINEQEPSYAGAINTAYKDTVEPYFFCGADDLRFESGWLENAFTHMGQGIDVVGTNDLANPDVLAGEHATHYLVRRSYIKDMGRADGAKTVLYPYKHNYCDTEFIQTAIARGAFKSCPQAIVEHKHWAWGKRAMDEQDKQHQQDDPEDRRKFEERKHLWQDM